MSRLQQLYQDMILTHNRNPHNFREMDPCTHHAHGVNTLCGDDFHVYLHVEDKVISDVSFHGQGCAISKSSGSLMTKALIGMNIDEALTLKDDFLGLLIQDKPSDTLGKLTVFEGVKKYPVRVKCATLVWRALESALSSGEDVTTE